MSKLVTALSPRNLMAAMSYASAASSCVPMVHGHILEHIKICQPSQCLVCLSVYIKMLRLTESAQVQVLVSGHPADPRLPPAVLMMSAKHYVSIVTIFCF
uniref:Uncharacterized protein n=1 Tax=Oryza brachyantha TaxID=4533 RepID=J3MGG3_ORYBR